MMQRMVALRVGTAMGLMMAAMPALAQQSQDAASHTGQVAETATATLEEIVVTARRREESLQEVPLSVTALSADALEQKAVRDIFDLQMATPGLSVTATQSQGRAVGGYNIRGQKAAADDAPPGVVAYLNEVPVFGGEVSRAVFDLANVQMLKGPQGTLFGKNTNGGAVLFTSKRPTFDLEGYVTGRVGNLNDRYVEGALNVPISPTLAVRVAGNLQRRDGFTKNKSGPDLDNQHHQNARASIRFEPNSDFSNDTVVNYTKIDERGPGYIISQFFPQPPILAALPAPLNQPSAGIIAAANEQVASGVRNVNIANPGFTKVEGYGVSNTTTYNVNDSTMIKNIFGFHDQKFSGLMDYDNIPADLLSVGYARHSRQITDELQVQTSLLDDRLNLITGAFYLKSKEDPFGGDTRFGATSAGYVFTPLFFYNPQYTHRDESSRALFAQAGYNVTDTVTLTAGYRHTWDKSELFDQQYRVFVPGTILLPFTPPASGFRACSLIPYTAGPTPLTVDAANCERRGDVSFNAGNYTVSADWKPEKGTLLYLAHRHGYKSGGFNVTSPFSGPQNVFKPEKVNDVEAGVKLERSVNNVEVRFNASGFHSWYNDLQLTQTISDSSGPQSLTQNAGKARLWGGEAELLVMPVEGLTLGATLNYFDGKFEEGVITGANAVRVDLKGRAYHSQPKYTWSLSAAYTTDIAQDGTSLTGSVFYTWRGNSYFNYDEVPGNKIDSFGLLNARLELNNIAGSAFSVALFGRNITDKKYAQSVLRAETFGFISRLYGEPATYGIEATYRF